MSLARSIRDYSTLHSWIHKTGLQPVATTLADLCGVDEVGKVIGNFRYFLKLKVGDGLIYGFADSDTLLDIDDFVSLITDSRIHKNFEGDHVGNMRISSNNNFCSFYNLISLGNSYSEQRARFLLWLIVQAWSRYVEFGCKQDENIEKVLKSLLSKQQKRKWSKLDPILREIESDWSEEVEAPFLLYGRLLANRAGRVLKENGTKELRELCRYLTQIATGEVCPSPERVNTQTSAGPKNASGSFPGTISGFLPTDQTSDSNPWISFDGPNAGNDSDTLDLEGPDTNFVQIDPSPNPLQERLSLQSIRLFTAEHLMFLPWSWDKPNPAEIDALFFWIERALSGSDLRERLGALFVSLGLYCSRTLRQVLDFTIENLSDNEWRLSEDLSRLHRLSPSRHDAWHPNETHLSRISSFEDIWTLELSDEFISILAEAHILRDTSIESLDGPKRLAHVWASVSPDKIEVWFNSIAKQHFPRLTSGKIANWMSQIVFEKMRQPDLASLISSNPKQGLAASVSYSVWKHSTVRPFYDQALQMGPHDDNDPTLLGSLCSFSDEEIASGVARAIRILESDYGDDPIRSHNLICRYTVVALLAATGGRPILDPFESLTHFDLSRKVVYLNDKSDDHLHTGRIVPLPSGALTVLSQYIEHLSTFGSLVKNNELSALIASLLSGDAASQKIPLFFYLSDNIEVRPIHRRSLFDSELFNLEIPSNALRHRFYQRLLESEIDHEVASAWMGHSSREVATYGATSVRSLLDDINDYRHLSDSAFDLLGFRSLNLPDAFSSVSAGEKISEQNVSIRTRHFGVSLRQVRRLEAKKAARKLALNDIIQFLSDRSFDELETTEIDELVTKMLLTQKGLPHPNAALRLTTLVRAVRLSGSDQLAQIRLRAGPILSESPELASSSIKALKQLSEIKLILPDLLSNFSAEGRHTIRNRFLGTVSLLVEKRIGYTKLAEDVFTNKNHRVCFLNNYFHIEYSEALDPSNFRTPVQRLAISENTARLLLAIPSEKTDWKKKLDQPLYSEFSSLQTALQGESNEEHTPTLQEYLKILSDVIDLANRIDLPVAVGQALNGNSPTTSLCIPDLLRIRTNRIYHPPSLTENASTYEGLIEAHSAKKKPSITQVLAKISHDEHINIEACELFKETIKDKVKGFKVGNRKRTAKALVKFCNKTVHAPLGNIQLLGQWIAHLVEVGKKPGNQRYDSYSSRTLQNYLSRLYIPLRDLSAGINLLTASSEDITQVYSDIIESAYQKGRKRDHLAGRISQFHRWLMKHGADEPDWSELQIDDAHRSVNPGYLSNEDICWITSQIDSLQIPTNQRLFLQTVLCFGLNWGCRKWEVLGLRRCDISKTIKYGWVLTVVQHRHRQLKGAGSRRVLPQLYDIDVPAEQYIDALLTQYDLLNLKDDHQSLFKGIGLDPLTRPDEAEALIRLLIELIKKATGSPRAIFHWCRHSGASRNSASLLPFQSDLKQLILEDVDETRVQQIMLGDEQRVSRRTLPAIALYQGHISAQTTLKNYIHILTDWIDELTPVDSANVVLEGAIYPESWESSERPEILDTLRETDEDKPTLGTISKFLFSLPSASSVERAASNSGLPLEFAQLVHDQFFKLNGYLVFKGTNGSWMREPAEGYPLLRYISPMKRENWLSREDIGTEDTDIEITSVLSMINARRVICLSVTEQATFLNDVMGRFSVTKNRLKVEYSGNTKPNHGLFKALGMLDEEIDAVAQTEHLAYRPPSYELEGGQWDSRSMVLVQLTNDKNANIRNSYELAFILFSFGLLAHWNQGHND